MNFWGKNIVNPLQRKSVADHLQASKLAAFARVVLLRRLPSQKNRRYTVSLPLSLSLILSLLLTLFWLRPLHAVI